MSTLSGFEILDTDPWRSLRRPLLTPVQSQVLVYIRGRIHFHGEAPTRMELCEAMGWSSPNAAQTHLTALVRKGYLEIVPDVYRGIRIPEEMT